MYLKNKIEDINLTIDKAMCFYHDGWIKLFNLVKLNIIYLN